MEAVAEGGGVGALGHSPHVGSRISACRQYLTQTAGILYCHINVRFQEVWREKNSINNSLKHSSSYANNIDFEECSSLKIWADAANVIALYFSGKVRLRFINNIGKIGN